MKLGIILIFMLVSICHGLKLSIDPPCNDDLFAINPNQVKPVSNNQKYPSGAAANNQNVNASVQSNIVTQGTINGQQQPTSNFNNNRNNNPNMNPNNSNNTSNSNPINNSNSNSNSSDQSSSSNINAILNKHNEYRRKHNVPDLILDDNLNKEAQTYAQKLVGHGLDHDKSNNKSGENLYKGSSNNLGSSVDLWYNEYQFYNYESGGFSMKTGHFTQLVWKMTTSLGVGIAKDQNSWIVVCRYFPPGNVEGQYIQNVLKPKSKLK